MTAHKASLRFIGGPWNGYTLREPIRWIRDMYYGTEQGDYKLQPCGSDPTEREYLWIPRQK